MKVLQVEIKHLIVLDRDNAKLYFYAALPLWSNSLYVPCEPVTDDDSRLLYVNNCDPLSDLNFYSIAIDKEGLGDHLFTWIPNKRDT